MEIAEFQIRVSGVGRYRIYPVGDLQMDSPGFDRELFNCLVAEIKSDPFPIVIGMGDYEDNFRPKVQAKIDVMTADDGDFRKSMDADAWRRLDKTTEALMPIFKPKRGLCIGLLKGHHFYKFGDGVNSVQKMCGTFGCKYMDEMAYIRVVFYSGLPKKNSLGSNQWEILIHAQHGDGGAGFTGPDIANLERRTVPYWEADLYLRGHSTKRWAAPFMEYKLSHGPSPRLVTKTKWAVNTGGFMRGHLDGESTYVSRKNMPPANLGYSVIEVDLKRHRPEISISKNIPACETAISVTLR